MLLRSTRVILLVLLSVTVQVKASRADEVQLPPGTGPIPELLSGASSGAIVLPEHASRYTTVLPKEVADLIAQGSLVLDVARQPLPGRVDVGRGEPSPHTLAVQQDGALSGLSGVPRLPLFSTESLNGNEGNKIEQAYKILWNAALSPLARGVVVERALLTLFPFKDSEGRVVEFSISRAFGDQRGSSGDSAKTFFRERLSLLSPASLKGISWLTFRFFGAEEDYLWASSSLIRRTRQMTGSNRSDSLFAGSFSPDDLFVWSGKVEGVRPIRVERRVMLVPISLERRTLTERENGDCLWSQFGRQAIELNRDVQRFKGYPGWIPTRVRFSPRSVWKVDVASLDPLSLDTLQTVVLDVETQFPVYRSVWGRDGRIRKVVIGVLGTIGNESISVPWLFGELIAYPESGAFSVVAPTELSLCTRAIAGATSDDLDPSALVEPEPTPSPISEAPSLDEEEERILREELVQRD